VLTFLLETLRCYLFTVFNSGLLFRHGKPFHQLLSSCFPPWPWTLTYDLDPESIEYCLVQKLSHGHTDTHTHQTNCSSWTTKVIDTKMRELFKEGAYHHVLVNMPVDVAPYVTNSSSISSGRNWCRRWVTMMMMMMSLLSTQFSSPCTWPADLRLQKTCNTPNNSK